MPPPAFVHYVVLDVPNITQNTSFMGIFRQCSGLEVNFDVYEYQEGGNNDFVHRLPGCMRYPNLTLSWGICNDESLLKWFFKTHEEAELQEITLTLAKRQGDVETDVRKFTFADAFPIRWSGPAITGGLGSTTDWGETLEIAHSGLKLT
jgi:phage tail-like protein